MRLIGAHSVGSGVGPVDTRVGVVVRGVVVGRGPRGRRSRDGLWQRILRQLPLEVQQLRVFVQKAAVACMWREPIPIGGGDEVGKRPPLPAPARASPDGVLLCFLLSCVAPAAQGGFVCRNVGAGLALLGVVTASEIVESDT